MGNQLRKRWTKIHNILSCPEKMDKMLRVLSLLGAGVHSKLNDFITRVYPHLSVASLGPSQEPIRAELFSVERLEQHGESLAAAQRVTPKPAADLRLPKRLRDNEKVLRAAYHTISGAIREERTITPAADWLVDNFYVVEEQVHEIQSDLPPGFYRQLPKLKGGPFEGYPRVFELAWAFVAHMDSHFDPHMLRQFIRAYQRVQLLTIGELWAIAITLRIVLVENLRRLSEGIVVRRAARQEADALADRLLGVNAGEAESAHTVLRHFVNHGPLPTAFAVRLVQRLRDQDPKVMPALLWLDERLAAQGTTADDVVREEHQWQGATNVTVRNVITSMRLISAIDWSEMFESVSLVDALLRANSNFATMDFATRDIYRHAIEELARGSTHSELDVAQRTLQAAKRAGDAQAENDIPQGHEKDPGYYLIAKGRRVLEKELGFRASAKEWLNRANALIGIAGYLSVIAATTLIIIALVLQWGAEPNHTWILCIFALIALIPALDLAIALVNRGVTNRFGATILPGMELRDGVPPDLRSLVVMPILLTLRTTLEEQIEQLGVHHLANSDGDIYFALLSDWTDSFTESAPGDNELLDAAIEGIARLNRLYGPAQAGDRFLLFHRQRMWNEGQRKWIGWERKRGKLHELNRLLRGATDTTFVTFDGRLPVPAGIRYVITLDGDTRLPRGAVKRLIGKMSHPLNRPIFDPRTRRVLEGHAVLQPRVTPSLPMGRDGSPYQRIFSSACGLDPYAFAVSDVYQDLFGEGSYSGKGIYDVDIFEAAMEGRIPENTILSHDLFEGTFARSGLVSDIEVVEEFPSRYDVASARQHRWTRGDWQLLPWILGQQQPLNEGQEFSAIPPIGRWKMVDNLRRSLSSVTALVVLLSGWTLPFVSACVWSGFVLTVIAVPMVLPLLAGVFPRHHDHSKRVHFHAVGTELKCALSQIVLHVTFLANQACVMADAIIRTLFRLFVSRRMLLEWVSAAEVNLSSRLSPIGFYRQMAAGVILACAIFLFVLLIKPSSVLIAAPFVILWVLSPAIAWRISLQPTEAVHTPASANTARSLRLVARRTWRFFETFVTIEDHMLPPDNFQEQPVPVIAHRTSPTNLGLYLLSVITARDFGWHGLLETIERLEVTIKTMSTLELFRGHFYNWYDTLDLRPLDPKYISSVDSGNLAGHLITLGSACREIATHPLGNQWLTGIEDAVELTRECLHQADTSQSPTIRKQLDDTLDTLSTLLRQGPVTPVDIAIRLAEVEIHAKKASSVARTLIGEHGDGSMTGLLIWADAIYTSILSHQRDLAHLMPWAELIARDHTLVANGDSASKNNLGNDLASLLDSVPTVASLPDICAAAISILTRQLAKLASQSDSNNDTYMKRDALTDAFRRSSQAAMEIERRLNALSMHVRKMFDAMAFDFLFDQERQLLSIGYRVADESLDPSSYDLLASEARLASFVAIAKGNIPTRHWFRLGRSLTPVGHGSALTSWSGSMFEYLMPSLVMRAPAGSLLEQTSHLIVRLQMEYGARFHIPWGISESAYNARDLERTYQYSSFGIPDLGFKRGLGENIVIAPYATALASMVDPSAAALNFTRLAEAGGRGEYGWYEALDYTKTRLPEGLDVAIVHAYMAHHQGMSIIAIANTLHDGAMRARFHAEPIIQATELLLQERMPRDVAIFKPQSDNVEATPHIDELVSSTQRRFHTPHTNMPRTHLLSNGRYTVMITAAGSGYSRWRDIAITRWREDATCDGWGSYVFLRDTRSGDVWSAGYQPIGVEPDRYEVAFSEGRAEIARDDGTITTEMEVAVSPEDDAEVRRVSITNLGIRTREIEITSYAEIVLAPQSDDDGHPAFSKLFVETEFISSTGTLLATRRPRSPGSPQVWAAHLAVVEGQTVGDVQFETDRARFLWRTHGIRTPSMVYDSSPSNTAGAVLDPIFSLRNRLRIPPRTTVRVAFWTVVASSRSDALDLMDKHHDAAAFDRATMLAWTQAQVELHHLGIDTDDAHLFQRLANRVIYSDPTLRPPSEILKRGAGTPSMLWAHGISGDIPIVLVQIDETSDLGIVRQLLLAHEYWRLKQLAVDLVILNERATSYIEGLQVSLEALVRAHQSPQKPAGEGVHGAVFVLRADLISLEVCNLLRTSARAVLFGRRGSLSEQVKRLPEPKPAGRARKTRLSRSTVPQSSVPHQALEFYNGLGGFADNGREYVTILKGNQVTPAPWINVIANASFGFQVSTEGGGYTWAINSQQNLITPRSNDPVSDTPGEAIYLRDEDSGELWTPTALPIREEKSPYEVRHGQGYSQFKHTSHGISLDLLQYVPVDDPIKISRLKVTNHSGRTRHFSVTAYVEWVLGASRTVSAPHIITEIDSETGAMLARNPWNAEFGQRVAFADLAGQQTSWTGDRAEFLGRNGALDDPVALAGGIALSKRVGAGFDPCGALQTQISVKANGMTEIVFFLGETATKADAKSLLKKYRAANLDAVLGEVVRQWDDVLETVHVTTPDRAMDIMLNRWLLYQTLACRVWARSAFYQASGAYGFRDQLQDVMALGVSKPELMREHLMRAAARQFIEGDVQHWWLPESGRGVRTRISDDRVWLPYVAAHYVEVTNDLHLLDEMIPFLEGPALRDGEHEAFFQPTVSYEQATLFEHCARALDLSLATGSHGLPLMGTGDWNDGMNLVGEQGKGESIWLGWFLHTTLTSFARLAVHRGESGRAAAWRQHATSLGEALEREGWDGDWYRRAYFDDGTPLGSVSNDECRIDSIAQSWSVISKVAKPDRATRAMAALEKNLIRRHDEMILLLTPPFDDTPLNPGYIKGYPPGIRENGGQYTHAAIWSLIAFSMLGDGDKASELFSMLNPINHSTTPDAIHRYKVEPYVTCADIYSMPPNVGRGGWTWYTGSAAWMYRAGLEWILGFHLQGTMLILDPCIPKIWPGFEIIFRYHSARYDIKIENPNGVSRGIVRTELDDVILPSDNARIPLVNDGATHRVKVVLG